MAKCWKDADWKTRRKWLGGVLVSLILVFVIGYVIGSGCIELRSPITSSDDTTSAAQNDEPPAEFLFIDVDRVGAYLAQFRGGAFSNEHVSQKLVEAANAGVELGGAKAGISSQEENFVEREVTPTAASSFAELERELEDEQIDLEEGFLHRFEERVANTEVGQSQEGKVQDGDFVRFEALVKGPTYLDPYLAINRNAPRSALLPVRARRKEGRELLAAQRNAAKGFIAQVGKNPRAVLTVRATQGQDGAIVKYLMPVHVKQLSEERSLLRTGGVYTVVGKVVRVFMPPKDAGKKGSEIPAYPYIDTPTRQTWRQALRGAPGELICRSNLACAGKVEEDGGMRGGERRQLIAATRAYMLRELKRETRLEGNGALIVPVAIYR